MRFAVAILTLLALVAALWPSEKVRASLIGVDRIPQSRVLGDSFPRTLVDPAGREKVLHEKPRRIISMILSGDEILMDLVEPDRIAGLTYFATDPASSNCAGRVPANIPAVDDNLEQVIPLEPDLMLVAGYTEATFVRPLISAGIPLLHMPGYHSLDNIRENITLISRATGEDERGAGILRRFDGRIEEVRYRVAGLPRPKVLFLFEGNGTHGAGTVIDEVITVAGGENIAATEAQISGTRQLSLESAISLDPEVILMTRYAEDPADPGPGRYLEDPNWREVRAVKNRRVHAVTYRSLITTSHYLADGVEAVARLLHPEAWSE